jgi:hypothetical protein
VSHDWNTITLTCKTEALQVLTELRGKGWLCRGQSRHHDGGLVPTIDRCPRENLSRLEKLTLERRSIDLFRSTARFFADPGEQGALTDDIIALMVLRHYGVPTRLLDWSKSPYVAAFFSVCNNASEDGEIWAFDNDLYAKKGKQQWRDNPETTIDGSGSDDKFDAKLTAFSLDEPPDWFICGFYTPGFPRQNAQQSVYTMTARFNHNHATAIASLLGEPSLYRRYVVKAGLKPALLKILQESHGIWRGSLYPDSAGAAATAHTIFVDVGV